MLSLVIVGSLALLAAVSGEDCAHTTCNRNLIKYYQELGCQPIQTSGECCPSKYDCTSVLSNRAPNKCYLKGKSFDTGATLSETDIGDKCTAECRCLQAGGQDTKLTCVNIECPELFSGPPPPGCVRLYTHDKCCSTGEHCGNDTKSKDAFTCEYGGKSYVVGQKFWPDEKPCMSCICQQGFDGTLKEPWCQEINCGIEIHYSSRIKEGCAPIYFGNNRCCPIGWRCPESSDSIVASDAAVPKDGPECDFGKLRLKVTQKLNSEKSCVECKCSLPPHVSCVQSGYC